MEKFDDKFGECNDGQPGNFERTYDRRSVDPAQETLKKVRRELLIRFANEKKTDGIDLCPPDICETPQSVKPLSQVPPNDIKGKKLF